MWRAQIVGRRKSSVFSAFSAVLRCFSVVWPEAARRAYLPAAGLQLGAFAYICTQTRQPMKYVSVLLPLALPGTYTYTLAPELAAAVQVGSRVVVQFGARRYYTGVVTQLCDAAPQAGIALKPVVGVADTSPTVLPAQLRLWQWMAQYYMCTEGEVHI